MASRASKKSRWLLRDLPRSYIVLAVAVGGAALVAVSVDWSSPPPPEAAVVAQPTKAELEKRYRGSIIFPTDHDGICLTVLLDNRTGNLTEGGYGKCQPDKPRRVAREPIEQARLRALGSAFRH
jgi:hypothetical protein